MGAATKLVPEDTQEVAPGMGRCGSGDLESMEEPMPRKKGLPLLSPGWAAAFYQAKLVLLQNPLWAVLGMGF